MRQIKFSLLVLTTIFAASLSTYADRASAQQAPQQVDLIGVGASIINSLINPPSRTAEINAEAEVRKAKIAADADIAKEKLRIEASKSTDRVTPVLNEWGVARVPCAEGLVFINGISTETVCIQPSTAMKAGSYTYDSAKQKLVRNSNNVQTSNNVRTSTNGQTSTNVQTVQTTRESNFTGNSRRSQGF